jgi:hypothetical protein
MSEELFVIIIDLLISGANADHQNLTTILQTYIHTKPYVTVFFSSNFMKNEMR